MFFYPLMDLWSMGAVWALLAGSMVLLVVLPWLPPKRTEPVAVVSLDNCNGCGFCVADCPYEAITLAPRSDNRPHTTREAVVIAENCVSCGICAGACPFSMPFRSVQVLETGIDLPQRNVQYLLDATRDALANLTESPRILIYGCDHGVDVDGLSRPDTATLSLPCIAALPPNFVRYALRHGADGVIMTGCRQGDCYHRLGDEWLRSRLNYERRPWLRRSVDRARIGVCWAAPLDRQRLLQEVDDLRRSLRGSSSK
jgi:ferredoxin